MRSADLLTVAELAQALGVSRQAIYELVNRGTFPRRFVGRQLVFSRLAVIDIVTSPTYQARRRSALSRDDQLRNLGVAVPRQLDLELGGTGDAA